MPADHLANALARSRGGDEDGIRSLYRWLNPPLLRYLEHHAGPAGEDIASEVWLAIANDLGSFEGTPEELRALAFTIARRRLVDHHRRNARRVQVVPMGELRDPAALECTAEQAEEQLTVRRAVEALVRFLPAEQAEVMLLRVLGDLDVSTVASILGRTPAAVRAAQYRALKTLHSQAGHKAVTK